MERRDRSLIIFSKIQAPQIKTKTLERTSLIGLLSNNLDKKIILLCAGAGYGKTTLLSQFISVSKIPHIYYHLEKNDSEPAIFFSYLIAAIRKIIHEFGHKTESLRHFFNYPRKYWEIIAGTFVNEITEHLKKDLYVVLEDYHSLEPSMQIDKILLYLLEHIPPKLHFIISTRTMPSVPLSRFRMRDEMFELQTKDLRFTKKEIAHLFKKIYSISLKESELDRIDEHSEGWPTSLRLMIQSSDYLRGIKSSDYIRRILDTYYQSQTNLFNYFAQEIYNQESKDVRQFLIDCSVLEWLTPDLCDAIMRRRSSRSILLGLTTRNAFIVKMPGQGYRFHKLFRDFLHSKLTDMHKEKKINRRVGDFYLGEGRLEEAVRFYLRAEEYIKAASAIEAVGFTMIEQGKSGILSSYIESIPKSIWSQRPSLLMNYAQSLIHIGRTDEARNSYLKAAKILEKKPRKRLKYADALYELGGISFNQGNFKAAKKWFHEALGVCPQPPRLIMAAILNSLGLIYSGIGGRISSEAPRYFQRALKVAQKNGYKDLEASILNNWAMFEFRAGNLSSAYAKLSKMVGILQKLFTPHCGVGFFNAARLSLLLGHKKDARLILDAGAKTCSPYNDFWSMATIWKGYSVLYQEIGDLKKAKHFTNKSLEICENLGVVRLIITALTEMCKINIRSGELRLAERNCSEIWWFKKTKDDLEAVPILVTEAKLRIAQERFGRAENILKDALILARKFRLVFDSFLIHIELSKALYFQGRIKKAIFSLEKAVKLGRTKGYDYLLLQILNEQKWMLPIMKREKIETKYISSIIKKAKSNIHWIDVFFFGLPKLIIDDCEVPDDAWQTLKAKKLFFYLLLHRNEKVSHDALIDAFWQKSSYKSAQYNLRKTIQYIRQSLKVTKTHIEKFIISSKGSYQIDPQVSIMLDIDRFQDSVVQLKTLKGQDKKFKSFAQNVLSVYKKGFAVHWYDGWAEERRRFYQSLYEDCLLIMAKYYFDRNKYKESIIWYKKLVGLDFYNEIYHHKLMIAFSKIGKFRELKQDFDRLKKILKKELGTEPQKKTVDIYESLIH